MLDDDFTNGALEVLHTCVSKMVMFDVDTAGLVEAFEGSKKRAALGFLLRDARCSIVHESALREIWRWNTCAEEGPRPKSTKSRNTFDT